MLAILWAHDCAHVVVRAQPGQWQAQGADRGQLLLDYRAGEAERLKTKENITTCVSTYPRSWGRKWEGTVLWGHPQGLTLLTAKQIKQCNHGVARLLLQFDSVHFPVIFADTCAAYGPKDAGQHCVPQHRKVPTVQTLGRRTVDSQGALAARLACMPFTTARVCWARPS